MVHILVIGRVIVRVVELTAPNLISFIMIMVLYTGTYDKLTVTSASVRVFAQIRSRYLIKLPVSTVVLWNQCGRAAWPLQAGPGLMSALIGTSQALKLEA